jgi:hypothetical protein
VKLIFWLIIISFICSQGTVYSQGSTAKASHSASPSMEQKIHRIEVNGRSPHPDQTPIVFTEQELNSYLSSNDIDLPVGVRSVKLEGAPGIITGTAEIDFDRIREGSGSSNPLLSIFSGIHEVIAVAHAYGAGGEGFVHVDSVSLDGVDIPHFVLELFVENFLQPKYSQIGIDSRFKLPNRLDTAKVGLHTIILTQK